MARRVEIVRGQFAGETGFVKASGPAGVYVCHTLPPIVKKSGVEPRDTLIDSWFSEVSLQDLPNQGATQ